MSSTIEQLVNREYQYGFSTDIEAETLPPGLTEDTVRFISAKKQEPEWLLEWRLKAFRRWQTMTEPHWPNVTYPPIDYQAASYWSAPKSVKPLASLDDADATEWIPALFTIVLMSFTYNIGVGMTAGLLLHPLLKVATGRGREVPAALWVLAALSLLFYLVYPYR